MQPRTAQTRHNKREGAASCNIASHLPEMAARIPDHPALIVQPSRGKERQGIHTSFTFAQLEAISNKYANGLTQAGVTEGTRTLLMVRPGVEFVGLVFALFKIGAPPVLIDPGMGVRRMLECIRDVHPDAMVGIPQAHLMRVLRPGAFRSVEHTVTVGSRRLWGGPTLESLIKSASDRFETARTAPDQTAAILFTSGATGPAKGVIYEHGMFDAQVRAIRDQYDIRPGEVDLPGFPLFALFNPALGMTSVLPDMDPTHPARVKPERIVEAIHRHKVTSTFGSPAMWKRIAEYCAQRRLTLPSLRRVLIAGAPVPWRLVAMVRRLLIDGADVHTPYGATESLPVTSVSGKSLLAGLVEQARRGAGICIGTPLPAMDVRLIRISDDPVSDWSDSLIVPDGEPGEIVVRGPVVTKQYADLERATRLAKIRDGQTFWHRMGDVGTRDAEGRLWYLGRKAHRVTTEQGIMFTIPCESLFNEHSDVSRSALVGVGPTGRQEPVIVIEPHAGRFPRGRSAASFRRELMELANRHELTCPIARVLFRRRLPVDIRHNAKIHRELLAGWAAGKIR